MADDETNQGKDTNAAAARNGSSTSQGGGTERSNPSRSSAARSGSASRTSARPSAASEAAMRKQIAELKREVSRLNRALADQAEEAASATQGWYQSAADRASGLY
ncbi:MAG: hypothetical protein E5X93_25630, partial [Mesorhizobium sp.]